MKTIEKKHSLRWLKVANLAPHPRVQRSRFSQARADRIARDLDPEKFGILTVWRDGTNHWVIDGQHRLAALLTLGWEDQKVECLVYESLTEAEAAKLFRSQSKRTAVTALDDFLVALIEGEPEAVAINRIIESLGMKVGQGFKTGGVAAVQALQRTYRPNGNVEPQPEVLRTTLSIIIEAWGATGEAMQGAIIDGIGRVVATYNGNLSLGDLRRKLARRSGGASGIIGDARLLREMFPGTLPDAIATIVVNEYNKGRRSRKLAEWRSGRGSRAA